MALVPAYEAVRDASLELHTGEFISIVGRSGSGKSTLLALLGALTKPTEGKVLLDGTDVWALSEAALAAIRSRHIGFIFQFPSLLSNLTAVDNVAVPALLGGTMDAEQAYRRASRSPRACRSCRPRRRLSGQPVRRRTAPRGDCPCADQLAASIARRRADERPRRRHRDRNHQLSSKSCSEVKLLASFSSPTIWQLAKHAQRVYEMRQGVLAPLDLPDVAGEAQRPQRHLTAR